MRINYVVLIGLLLMMTGPVSAGEVKERGAYIGGALGVTEFDDDGAFDYGYDLLAFFGPLGT